MRKALLCVAFVATLGCGGTEQTGGPAPAVAPLESGFAEFGQSRIYYEIKGEGPPLVLIHGGLLDSRMWDDQFDVLATRYRVIRYDASSHGRSATPPDAYFDHVDLDRLLTHLGVDRAILVGLSFGGRVAVDFALEHPDRVEAIVAVSSGLGGFRFDSPEVLEHREELIDAWGRQEWDRAVEAFQRSWTDGPYRSPDEVNPGVRERVRQMARDGIERAAEGRTLDPPAITRLSELRVPMLIVVGALDMPDIHEIADLLIAANPDARRVIIEGAAHMVNLEQPDEFNRVVLGYLDAISGS
jgi:pimeloyl-ACP methyl ester carboxylesterase